jgi:RNA binding exosome subunit
MCLVLRLMSYERPVRRLDFRVFQHATEDLVKVMAALRFVSGSAEAAENRAEGYHGNPISVLEVSVTGRAALEEFWGRLRLAGLCAGVSENLEERISEGGELFIRFDKQEAVSGRLALSSGDDVVLARGRVLATVKGQEARADRAEAVEVMRGFLRELGKKP